MDLTSDFHAILGSPSQGKLGMVASLPHQRVKFPTSAGIGCVLGASKLFLEYVMKSRKTKQRMEIDTPERNVTISKSTTFTTSTPNIGVILATTEDIPEVIILEDENQIEAEVSHGLEGFGSISTEIASAEPSNLALAVVSISGAAQPAALETEIDKLLDIENLSLEGKDRQRVKQIFVETLEFRDGPELKPVDQLHEVIINPEYPEQKIKIGKQLSQEEREEIIDLLKNNLDVFAWRIEDMVGVNEATALHKMEVDKFFKPIIQTKRVYSNEKEKAIEAKVDKLLKAGIIREAEYPDWLANVILVKKQNGKWRMCVDFTNLNKAYPKDNYPLPRIDKLVDSIAVHQTLSFLDAYSGYCRHPILNVHS